MDQVLDFFRKLFDTADWPPRWHCGNWTEFHGWLYIISDLLIWSAYFAIPLVILKFVSKRTKTRFVRAYFLFAAFILACGSTHLLDAVTFWFPAYRLNALVRLITGVVSWVTVFYMIRILPMASSLRTYEDLEKEINERKRIEEELKLTNQQLMVAQEIARIGHWQWDIATNELYWSEQLFRIYGMEPHPRPMNYDDFIQRVYPDDREMVSEAVKGAFLARLFPAFTHRIVMDDGSIKVLSAKGDMITNADGDIVRMIGTAQDITEQQLSQQQLLERSRELELRNAELQKFAYVASHDLQEPLRKIMTFVSLLEKEDVAKDERTVMYMEKITQASKRMQQLIEDVLQFSSIRSEPEAFTQVSLNEVISQVLSDIEIPVADTGAVIRVDELPVVEGIRTQLGQLFQNLISNAIKFRKDGQVPEITISGEVVHGAALLQDGAITERSVSNVSGVINWERDQFLRLTLRDNGIGFDESYADKIFEIFQRLHNRTYTGTGIGLAICKKIVDNHHGVIYAQSKEGEGAAFTVILPLLQSKYFH